MTPVRENSEVVVLYPDLDTQTHTHTHIYIYIDIDIQIYYNYPIYQPYVPYTNHI